MYESYIFITGVRGNILFDVYFIQGEKNYVFNAEYATSQEKNKPSLYEIYYKFNQLNIRNIYANIPCYNSL